MTVPPSHTAAEHRPMRPAKLHSADATLGSGQECPLGTQVGKPMFRRFSRTSQSNATSDSLSNQSKGLTPAHCNWQPAHV